MFGSNHRSEAALRSSALSVPQRYACQCVVAENIHSHPQGRLTEIPGGGGLQKPIFKKKKV